MHPPPYPTTLTPPTHRRENPWQKRQRDLDKEISELKLSHDSKKSIREYADEAFEEKLGKAVDHCILSFAHEVEEATGGGTPQSQVEALAEAVYQL